jgi:uncharacterized protein (TIGR02246 family)
MKKLVLSIALAVAAAGIPVSVRAADPGDSVKRLSEDFVAGWNAHEPKKMAGTWANDGSLINPFGVRCGNRAEVEKLFATEHAGAMRSSTYTLDGFTLRKLDDAVMVGDWDGTITGMVDPGGNPLPPFPHHVTAVYQKRGGKWAVVAARAFQLLPPPGTPAK